MSQTKYDYYKTKEVESLMMDILEKKEQVRPVYDLELGYRYPSVEKTIDKNVEKTIDFLDNLVNLEILNKQLFDMELRCPTCNSPNVSVNYICPKCTSPTIRKTLMIEHYDCGYIGTVLNFGEQLTCPHCKKPLKDNYRNAGSVYECSACNQQIETPFINHWCRKCDHKFSFETAIYQPKYAYLPTNLTVKEIEQGILYLTNVVRVFEEQGLTNEENSNVFGASGVEHVFDAAFTGFGTTFYVDIHFSLDLIDEYELLKIYGKIRDVHIEDNTSQIFTLVIPGLDVGAETLAKSYYSRAYLIIGNKPSSVLSKLKTVLKEKISELQNEEYEDSSTTDDQESKTKRLQLKRRKRKSSKRKSREEE
jgi:hypothetical protein